ncbi:xanthine dehydrogenase accessory protein XdhC [Alphaproteobacteria bacterium KMM 3653]|uniref:Xanthine dehydrogenase accessory protein XdhC n=1 Tax=Harenicola maris TaxID=2841044 RepID=A0AAP2G9S7_9RHOB|nr:xanthine dehydrogenase accessory protein XdhC [Harenicola maris]
MSFDRAALAAAVKRHGKVARVVVAKARGSGPREAGASMLVWQLGQSGTIGGGTLEWQAAAEARALLAQGGSTLRPVPLGPELGQCCGGHVTLGIEVFAQGALPETDAHFARRLSGSAPCPLALHKALRAARGGTPLAAPLLADGWLLEATDPPRRPLWVWGAGHVGRAIVSVIAPLPDWQITWIDTGADRFPSALPEGAAPLVAADPARAVPHAPTDAHHLILTYSHALDLDLCHRLLGHGFASAGLIGSATKWARFRRRLGDLGHTPAQISGIACPIGDPTLGKHPQAIAVSVAAQLLKGDVFACESLTA